MADPPVNRQTLRDQVAGVLREAILFGEFEPGQRLREQELAERFDVSLTPVREALNSLAGTGLVVRHGRQGTHVRTLGASDVENLLSVRESLEALAVRQAIANVTTEDEDRFGLLLEQQAAATELARTDPDKAVPRLAVLNEEFHDLILERADNQWLASMLASIHDLLVFARAGLRSRATLPRRQASLEEHRRIASAITSRDGEAAVEHMRDHVRRTKQHVISLIADGPAAADGRLRHQDLASDDARSRSRPANEKGGKRDLMRPSKATDH